MENTTRIAPSPTGALHLGNARTFLANWALARQNGWKIVLRIDDLDGPRVKPGADLDAIEILQWLGIDWDDGPFYESSCLHHYRDYLIELAARGQIYPCNCTRKQIEAACLSAPHADQHELRYPGTCRPEIESAFDFESLKGTGVAWRLRVPDKSIQFADQVAGHQTCNVQQQVGDFLVTSKEGIASYQLACVVDDSIAGISDVVRGDDLIASTPRQTILAELLGFPPVRYWHIPIVVGSDGRRLAKRHGDTTIAFYRKNGVTANRIRGLVGQWCGRPDLRESESACFLEDFEIGRIPREKVVFSQKDHEWLLGKATKTA